MYFRFNPVVKGIKGTIIGAEACMWSELVTEANIDNKVWIRASTLAERLWNSEVIDTVPDVAKRLIA